MFASLFILVLIPFLAKTWKKNKVFLVNYCFCIKLRAFHIFSDKIWKTLSATSQIGRGHCNVCFPFYFGFNIFFSQDVKKTKVFLVNFCFSIKLCAFHIFSAKIWKTLSATSQIGRGHCNVCFPFYFGFNIFFNQNVKKTKVFLINFVFLLNLALLIFFQPKYEKR